MKLMPPARQLTVTETKTRGRILTQLGPGCVYCGGPESSEDHFRPVIGKNGMPTGYCNDAWNVVPCCISCNSSKGNRHWNVFLRGQTPRSPRGRRVSDWRRRENLLRAFESNGDPHVQRWDVRAVQADVSRLRRSLMHTSISYLKKTMVIKDKAATVPVKATLFTRVFTRSMVSTRK